MPIQTQKQFIVNGIQIFAADLPVLMVKPKVGIEKGTYVLCTSTRTDGSGLSIMV